VDQYKDIRYLYAVEGLSQREIARRLGISRNTVRRYCHGENIPGERKKPSGDCSRVITPDVNGHLKTGTFGHEKSSTKSWKLIPPLHQSDLVEPNGCEFGSCHRAG